MIRSRRKFRDQVVQISLCVDGNTEFYKEGICPSLYTESMAGSLPQPRFPSSGPKLFSLNCIVPELQKRARARVNETEGERKREEEQDNTEYKIIF